MLYQKRYNRLHRSIYGLSYDLYVLSIFSYTISIYCTMNYRFSSLVRTQLSKRFPIFYPIEGAQAPTSMMMALVHTVNLICCCMVLRQMFRYRFTKHVHQSISTLCVSVITATVVFSVFTFACASYNLPLHDMGKFGVFYLEHVNYLWVIGNIISCFRLAPQMMINWMGMCTQGLSSKYVVLTMVASLVAIIGNIASTEVPFYRIPFNYVPLFVPISHLVSLLIILYQAQYLYIGKNPYLQRGKA